MYFEGDCPYCDRKDCHLNNHIRMSAGVHGPQGVYPDDWSPDERRVVEPPAHTDGPEPEPEPPESNPTDAEREPPETDGGSTVEPLDGSSGEAAASEEVTALDLTDSPADARDYQCGECSEPVEYHVEECPSCSTGLAWRAVA